jgi:hypothetical protein
MKKYISWFLLLALMRQFTGCYSISPIDEINEAELTDFENNYVKINLLSGKVYDSKKYRHTCNIWENNFFIGRGVIYSPNSFWHNSFEGKIYQSEIDSQLIDNGNLNIWLKSKYHIFMRHSEFFKFTPETKKGFWILEESGKIFINRDDIKSIEVNSFNVVTTTTCILGISTILLGIIMVIGMANAFEDAL